MITFAQGSLGFMCNFTFEDHPMVLDHIFNQQHDKNGIMKPSNYIGVEERTRLKIRMGAGCDSVRKVYRGDQLENFE
jgi:NAD kinase